jgi:hypothetical protein
MQSRQRMFSTSSTPQSLTSPRTGGRTELEARAKWSASSMLLSAVEANLRCWSGRPVKLTGLALADRYQWTEPSRKPVALPEV